MQASSFSSVHINRFHCVKVSTETVETLLDPPLEKNKGRFIYRLTKCVYKVHTVTYLCVQCSVILNHCFIIICTGCVNLNIN